MSNLPQNIAKTPWLSVLLIILCTLSVYSPIVRGSFKVIYDSDHIVHNSLLQSFDNTGKIFTDSLFKAGALYRPIVLLSHMAEYQAFNLTPFFYYLMNILVHLSCALLVYVLMILLTKERGIGLLTAVLFAVHPAHWEAVSLLSGRADLFNTLFNLAALTTCVLYLRRLNSGWMFVSIACFALALLSHESRGSLVWVLFFYFLCMATDEESKDIRWLIFMPYAVIAFVFMGLRHGMAGLRWDAGGNYPDVVLGILSAVKSIVLETADLLVPMDVHFSRALPLEGPDTQTFIALAVFLSGLAVLWLFRKKISGIEAFLLTWFFVALWPVLKTAFMAGSDLASVPLTGAAVYMPSIPLIALLIMWVQRILVLSRDHSPLAKPLVTAMATGFIVLFFLLTFRQNILSTDESAMLKEAQRHQPSSAVIEYSLGFVAMNGNSLLDAQAHFEKAIQLNPDLIRARMGLGKILYDQGKFLDAVKVYESIQKPGQYQAVLENNLKSAYNILALSQDAILKKNPQDPNAYFSLGVFYAKLGELGKSIAAYQNVIELDPNNQAGLKRLALQFQGMIYQQMGYAAKAQENFERAK